MAEATDSKVCDGGGEHEVRRRPARALGLRRWLDRERGLGQRLSVRELVFELHVRRGLGLREVAQVLGISVKVVRGHLPPRGAKAGLRAPQSEADFTGLREMIGVALWETVAETFAAEGEVMLQGEKAEAGRSGSPSPRKPRLMATRIRALKQIAKLYGEPSSRTEPREAERRRVKGGASVERKTDSTPQRLEHRRD